MRVSVETGLEYVKICHWPCDRVDYMDYLSSGPIADLETYSVHSKCVTVSQIRLELDTILDVDWWATHLGAPLVLTGMFLNDKYDTSRGDGLQAVGILREILSRYKVHNRTTLRDFVVEVHQFLDEDIQEQRAAADPRSTRAMEKERFQAFQAPWRTGFARGGIQFL